MFDAVRNSKKIVQIFLALITLPFAFFGIDSYVRNSGVGGDVASVGETKITVMQFDQALRERQEQMQQALGTAFKPEMLNAPEVRLGVLNNMIDQRLLFLETQKSRLMTSDDALRDTISKIPSLQEDGHFSLEKYQRVLRAQGMSEQQFEAKFRQDLLMRQLIGPVSDTASVSQAQSEAMLRTQLEERQFSEFRITPEQFAAKVKVEAATVQKYYDDNKARFETPEQVKVDYLVLSLDTMQQQLTVSENEIKSWYETHKDKYQQPEERRASHILLAVKAGADKAAVRTRADELLKEARSAPTRFADLAKKNSDDTVSAKQGGDLGYFGRGMMVKVFEDAVFQQKEGDISEVVESEFGFHIIKLTGIKAARVRPLSEMHAEIEGELKRQAASRNFAEAAESFSNIVYEQSDSLQPAAEKFKLKIQHSGWLAKNPGAKEMAASGLLGNAKVLASLFSDDAVKNKRNTEAYEVAPNTLVSARVVEHQPAASKPLEEVKGEIEKLLKAQEIATLTKTEGEARLAELAKGEDKLSWSAAKSVSRVQGRELPLAAVQAIFKANVEKLPTYVGASIDDAYVLYKIAKVTPPEKLDEEQRKALQQELASILAQEDLSAYLNALRARYRVEINKTALESKER
ncbi:MAG: SurA N-terminal domain-containing protein [Propionivibrio sp.]|nr:SurA N-terminal domain-containing protein [Propionivibrio sp.]